MGTMLPKLYLASKSPRRHEILQGLHVKFDYIASTYKENISDVANLTPENKAAALASLKAMHAAMLLDSGLVIGADTIVVEGNEILGKPRGKEDARRMLEKLSGKEHRVISGIALVDASNKMVYTHSEVTYVYFRKLSERDIETYLNTKEPYDKAGAYGIQGHAALFVEKIQGCYFNVVGFPVVAFNNLVKEAGFDVIDFMNLEDNKR